MKAKKVPSTVEVRELISDLDTMSERLEKVPDDSEWSQNQLADLDELRGSGLRIAREVEALIETIQGSTP